jgi:hypothetical protein
MPAALGPLQCVAVVLAATLFVALVAAHGTTKADSQQYSVVVRIEAGNAGLTASEIAVRIGNMSVPATAIKNQS